MTSDRISFVVAIVVAAVTISACCGPFPPDGPDADDNLTVAVVVQIGDAHDNVREPICDATVTAFAVDEDGNVDEAAAITLPPATLDDECVYRVSGVDFEAFEVRASHPDHGDGTIISVVPDSGGGNCAVHNGLDGIDETVVLTGSPT